MPDDSGITLAEAKQQLSFWLAADAAVSTGQSYVYEVDGERQEKTQADAGEIRRNVNFWDKKVRELASGGGLRTFGVIPPS